MRILVGAYPTPSPRASLSNTLVANTQVATSFGAKRSCCPLREAQNRQDERRTRRSCSSEKSASANRFNKLLCHLIQHGILLLSYLRFGPVAYFRFVALRATLYRTSARA